MANVWMGRALNTPPQSNRAAPNVVIFHISASRSVSVADTYLVGKIPHGAILTQAVFFPVGSIVAKFGTSASLSLLFASATYSVGANLSTTRLGPAFQISVSDDAPVRYEAVTMVPSDGLSTGYLGDLVVTYVMPGSTL